MNRIDQTFKKNEKLLSIYFSAGHPELEDTLPILEALQDSGVDMVEIGLPFSDPLADGPTIQESSTCALRNGMTTEKLFDQLQYKRQHTYSTSIDGVFQSNNAIWNRTFLPKMPIHWY